MKKILIWLDDCRDPFDKDNEWVRTFSPVKIDKDIVILWIQSYDTFKLWIDTNGLPYAICFDHDLGDFDKEQEKTGYDCAKIIGEYCLDHNTDVPYYSIQSANPVGRKNIDTYLKNIQKFINNEK